MNLERSLAYTSLLEVSETFGSVESRAGSKVVSEFLEDYHAQPLAVTTATIYEYAKAWLASHNDLACSECGATYAETHEAGCKSALRALSSVVTLRDCKDN